MNLLTKTVCWLVVATPFLTDVADASECGPVLPSALTAHFSKRMPGFAMPPNIRLDPASVKADRRDGGNGPSSTPPCRRCW